MTTSVEKFEPGSQWTTGGHLHATIVQVVYKVDELHPDPSDIIVWRNSDGEILGPRRSGIDGPARHYENRWIKKED